MCSKDVSHLILYFLINQDECLKNANSSVINICGEKMFVKQLQVSVSIDWAGFTLVLFPIYPNYLIFRIEEFPSTCVIFFSSSKSVRRTGLRLEHVSNTFTCADSDLISKIRHPLSITASRLQRWSRTHFPVWSWVYFLMKAFKNNGSSAFWKETSTLQLMMTHKNNLRLLSNSTRACLARGAAADVPDWPPNLSQVTIYERGAVWAACQRLRWNDRPAWEQTGRRGPL